MSRKAALLSPPGNPSEEHREGGEREGERDKMQKKSVFFFDQCAERESERLKREMMRWKSGRLLKYAGNFKNAGPTLPTS